MLDFFTGWAGFFTLVFYGDLVLVIVAGAGFMVVTTAALMARVRWRTRLAVLAAGAAFFGLILAKGLGAF